MVRQACLPAYGCPAGSLLRANGHKSPKKIIRIIENALPLISSAANPGFSRLHATVQTVKKDASTQMAGQASVSAAQLAANRANSQLSTGPRSEEGKQISS